MLVKLQERFRNIHLYNGEKVNVLEFDAMKKYDVQASGLPTFLATFSALFRGILQLHSQTIPRRLTKVQGTDGNVAGEVMKQSENTPVTVSVC